MDIRTVKELTNSKYTVVISTENFSAGEDALLAKFGDPLVETGGTFTFGSITFSVGADARKLKSGFGAVTKIFDRNDTSNAEAHANIWAIEMQNRLRQAMATLKSNVDLFTGTTVEAI
jgi:hypothetical protein